MFSQELQRTSVTMIQYIKKIFEFQNYCTISKRNICYPSLQDKTTLCSPELRGGQFTFQGHYKQERGTC